MRLLELANGEETVVDNDVYEWASKQRWVLSSQGYVSRREGTQRLFLHRLICETPEGWHTDHINGDKLDNLRSNLRIASTKENVRNSGIRHDNKSGYKGVSFRKDRQRWSAEITKDGQKHSLGCYATAKEAGLAYNTAAQELYGEFARLNTIT